MVVSFNSYLELECGTSVICIGSTSLLTISNEAELVRPRAVAMKNAGSGCTSITGVILPLISSRSGAKSLFLKLTSMAPSYFPSWRGVPQADDQLTILVRRDFRNDFVNPQRGCQGDALNPDGV